VHKILLAFFGVCLENWEAKLSFGSPSEQMTKVRLTDIQRSFRSGPYGTSVFVRQRGSLFRGQNGLADFDVGSKDGELFVRGSPNKWRRRSHKPWTKLPAQLVGTQQDGYVTDDSFISAGYASSQNGLDAHTLKPILA
jgi:hypothetical protein